jgi:hypothetical protein
MINFTVRGVPRSAGSKTSGVTKTGRIFHRPASKYQQPWQYAVASAGVEVAERLTAAEALERTAFMAGGAIVASMWFCYRRPRSHYKGGDIARGELTAKAPPFKSSKPDVIKLARAVEDALSGVLFHDDAQIVSYAALEKRFWTFDGVVVELRGRDEYFEYPNLTTMRRREL